jgi:voltage-gated potassium channel
MKNHRSRFRQWRAAWRDTMLLVRDFRLPLLLFALIVVGGGLTYFTLAQQAGESLRSPVEGIYLALTMVFLQASNNFPATWYLQIFYFVMPIIGLSVLAQGLTEFGVVLFNRKARSKEWQMAVASTLNNHIILVGLGHLGYRVVQQLHKMNEDVAVVEFKLRDDLVVDLKRLDIPVIEGDATREVLLVAAGIARAGAGAVHAER